jgi:hypothetical protein
MIIWKQVQLKYGLSELGLLPEILRKIPEIRYLN